MTMTHLTRDCCHNAGPAVTANLPGEKPWVGSACVSCWSRSLGGGCAATQTTPATADKPACANPHCRWSARPDRIILNLTTAPATSQAVTWRTRHPVDPSQGPDRHRRAERPVSMKNARSVVARSETGDPGPWTRDVVQHAVVFERLTPDTVYAYRVGSKEAWSEWNQFQDRQP